MLSFIKFSGVPPAPIPTDGDVVLLDGVTDIFFLFSSGHFSGFADPYRSQSFVVPASPEAAASANYVAANVGFVKVLARSLLRHGRKRSLMETMNMAHIIAHPAGDTLPCISFKIPLLEDFPKAHIG